MVMAAGSGRTQLRYDACIIGAGADGLAAGAWLAARGLKVIVVERDARPGGRCATRQFHPGFRASVFADELPEIPLGIFRALDLARRGVILSSMPQFDPADAVRAQVLARAMGDAETVHQRGLFARRPAPPQPWPGEELASRSLAEHGAPAPLDGRLCDPSARTISCGIEVTDIRRKRGRAVAAGLADGSEVAARAFVSTLDLRRTFLSLFAWNELPRALVDRVGAFRTAPGVARLLVALAAPPETADREMLRPPIQVTPAHAAKAYCDWRAGTVPERPPATLRLVSAVDPFLAPDGCATLTVTLGAIPHTLFDGAWTHEKRNRLRDTALAIAEQALPGIAARVKAAELIVPPDIESQLGVSEGDLLGGDLSATQMLGYRPFPECSGTRTPVEGLYLAGPSSTLGPLMTCASGVAAATAVLADMRAGRLK